LGEIFLDGKDMNVLGKVAKYFFRNPIPSFYLTFPEKEK